jgi:hypothetical protein
MTETLRSINVTHPKAPNLTMRIGVFTPDVIGSTAKPESERTAVVEIHARNQQGQQEHVGTLTIDQFTDFAREIVRIGATVVPTADSVEEAGSAS